MLRRFDHQSVIATVPHRSRYGSNCVPANSDQYDVPRYLGAWIGETAVIVADEEDITRWDDACIHAIDVSADEKQLLATSPRHFVMQR